jgi:hypothetical protein
MSLGVMTWVWDHSKSRNAARLVLLAIADCASGDGTQAWPSGAELRRKAKLSARAVQNATQELIELGELKVEWNAGPGGCNRYTVLMRTPAESAVPPQNLRPRKDCAPAESAGGETRAESDTTGPEPPQNLRPAESAPPQNLRTEPSLSSSKNKNTSNRSRKRTEPPAEHPRFAEFWPAYPRREGKGKAREAFTKAIDLGADPEAVIAAAGRCGRHHARVKTETKYIPLPATWLNQERWEDEYDGDPGEVAPAPSLLPHCGRCDPQGRWVDRDDGTAEKCPDCHPDNVRNRT